MAKIKLDTKALSIPEKITRGQQIVEGCTNNPNAPNLGTALTEFEAATTKLGTDYNNAQAARLTAKQLTDVQDASEADWDGKISLLASAVEVATGGDVVKIESTKFNVRGTPAPVGLPSAPASVVATMGDLEGTIDVSWDRTYGARSYVVQVCPDPVSPEQWRQAGLPTKSSHTVTGLTSGSKYWFRVAAIGAAGQGPWSDQAMKMAP